jgi:Fic family protein
MSLARSEASSQRFYSMSARIREERGAYYRILEQTQRGTMEITAWMEWFLTCLTRAIEVAQVALSGVIEKARYWEKLRDVPLNERQRLVINRLLEGFEGMLTTSKWAALTKSSNDTALRDIQQLVERGVLVRNRAGGRRTSIRSQASKRVRSSRGGRQVATYSTFVKHGPSVATRVIPSRPPTINATRQR